MLGLSVVFCYIAITYFSSPNIVVGPVGRRDIIYSAPFFISGGMIYLYRHAIKNCEVSEWYQYGGLSLSHDVLPCVRYAASR